MNDIQVIVQDVATNIIISDPNNPDDVRIVAPFSRATFGLPFYGNAMFANIGSGAGDVAAGNDPRIIGAAQQADIDAAGYLTHDTALAWSVAGRTGDITLSVADIDDLATVARTGAYSALTGLPDLHAVALSGDYRDLANLPALAAVATSGAYADLIGLPALHAVATSGAYGDLTGVPALATVATSGAYGDLSGRPVLGVVATSNDYGDLSNLPSFASVAFTGSYSDLFGRPPLATVAVSGDYHDLTGLPALASIAFTARYTDLIGVPALSSVALSGAYGDLTGKPTLATVAGTGAYSDLIGAPALATVATSGSYTDLTSKPALHAVAISGDYNDLSNTPTAPALALVATSGAYTDLTGLPTLAAVATTGAYGDLLGLPSFSAVAFTGHYADLIGEPVLALVATSGSYGDLTGRPTLATVATSGTYSDLTGLPNFAAVALSGQYADLTGRPVLAPVAISGSYADLTGAPTLPTLAAVATSGAYADLTGAPLLATVAASGAYSDLSGIPSFAAVAFTGRHADLVDVPTLATVATSGSYGDLSGRPALATVATSGSYLDLTGIPNFAAVALSGAYTDLSGRPVLSAVALSGSYNDLADTPVAPILAPVATSGAYSDLTGKPALSTVALTGSYSDLTGLPAFSAVAFTGAYGSLSGKPALSTVALSGAYSDLTGTPTLAAVATSGSYLDLGSRPALAAVATSGAYGDLTGKPALAVVATTGSYTDLANQPLLKTVALSGVYNDLTGRPSLGTMAAQDAASVALTGGTITAVDIQHARVKGSASNVQREIGDIFADVVHAADYLGHIPDGAEDTGAAINAAIAEAAGRATGCTVYLAAGSWRVDLSVSRILAMSNVALVGAGAGKTTLYLDDTTSAASIPSYGGAISNAYRSTDPDVLHAPYGAYYKPIKNFHIGGMTIHGSADVTPTAGCQLVSILYSEDISIGGVESAYSRNFGMVVRECTGVMIDGCVVHHACGDGIAIWNCTDMAVVNNFLYATNDDAISCHSDNTAAAPVRSGILIANNVLTECQGIKVLGAKACVIANNVMHRMMSYGIFIGGGSVQGSTPEVAVKISGNIITDVFRRPEYPYLNQEQYYIRIDGTNKQAGTAASAPGEPDGTGTFNPLYGTGVGNLYVNNTWTDTTTPAAGDYWIEVTDNICVRTLPAVSAVSDWGYSELGLWVGYVGDGTGYYNGPVDDAHLSSPGIRLGPYQTRTLVARNTIQTGGPACVYFATYSGAPTLPNWSFVDLAITDNRFIDFTTAGIQWPVGSASPQRIRIERNEFDGDPFFRHSARGAGGTWTSYIGLTGIYMVGLQGAYVADNRFRNVGISAIANSAIATYLRNTLFGNPAGTGFVAGNSGIGWVQSASPSWEWCIEDSDPASPTFRQMLNETLQQGGSMPTTGTYVRGHFVRQANPAIISGTKVLLGWSRLTTGNAHVSGTDWAPIYANIS